MILKFESYSYTGFLPWMRSTQRRLLYPNPLALLNHVEIRYMSMDEIFCSLLVYRLCLYQVLKHLMHFLGRLKVLFAQLILQVISFKLSIAKYKNPTHFSVYISDSSLSAWLYCSVFKLSCASRFLP